MATVTGLTAEHMLALSDANIVAAEVVGNDLILTTRGGQQINAGNVRGSQGPTGPVGPTTTTVCTSTTRPVAPIDGQQIYETDTLKTLYYYTSKSGWFPSWGTAWGVIAVMPVKTNSSANYSATGTTDMVLTSIPVRNDRNYRAHLQSESTISATATWSVELNANNVNVGRFQLLQAAYIYGWHIGTSVLYKPTATGAQTFRVYVVETSGTATINFPANVNVPRQFWIEDIGPRM